MSRKIGIIGMGNVGAADAPYIVLRIIEVK